MRTSPHTALIGRWWPVARDRAELARLFLAERRDPVPFHRRLAENAVGGLPFPVAGARVLDLGCGPGHMCRALERAGARVVPVDLDPAELAASGQTPNGAVVADGRRLPLAAASIDAVVCSNMLEHTLEPELVLDEVERVLRCGGSAWLSWTNWYSPWGGHDLSPWHYLGRRLGPATHDRLFRRPLKHEPGRNLFPLHIGAMLRAVNRRPGLHLVDAAPRYWPSQRWLLHVPGLREVAAWNCVLVLERAQAPVSAARSDTDDRANSSVTDTAPALTRRSGRR